MCHLLPPAATCHLPPAACHLPRATSSSSDFFLLTCIIRMHHAQVVRSLEAAQHLKLQTEKMKVEEQKVFITNTTTCALTNQAIGDKAFVR
jgi:hypothetical protein